MSLVKGSAAARRIQAAVEYVQLLRGTDREDSARAYLQRVCDQVRLESKVECSHPEDECSL